MLKNAKWITYDQKFAESLHKYPCLEYRRSLDLCRPAGKLTKATVFASAIGLYKITVNGKEITDTLFNPGWTNYQTRIQYQTYDVTSLIEDKNDISILSANGWAVHFRHPSDYDHTAVIFAVYLTFEDGSSQYLSTDESWDVYTNAISGAHFYHGESVDLTHTPKSLGKAVCDTQNPGELIETVGEPIREMARVAPKKLIITPKGERVIDFGQNLAGYVEIKVKGRRGDRVALSFAEVLDSDGNFYTANYRSAKNDVNYVLSGENDVLKPTFSFQGYRYIRLDEYPFEEVDLSCFTSVAVFSDMERTGNFDCGNEKINKLYSNIIWGQRSNYLDVPTDCPQRDERLGWTGDAQVFCKTAAINYNVKKFFEKWLGDVRIAQGNDGAVPSVVPTPGGKNVGHRASAAWADAATVCPMEIYLAYGDKELLKKQFSMMKAWVDYVHRFGKYEFLWIGDRHFGDWLALDNPDPNGYVGATQTDLIASAFYAYSTSLVVRAGKILGEDVSEYEELYTNVRNAFRSTFMKDSLPCTLKEADGLSDRVQEITQTGIVLILKFGLCEDCEREKLVNKLCELIDAFDGRMSTGFVGTPYILHALSENGRADRAYDLLFQEKCPSWLFSVNRGATTIWEHWDSMREDGSFWSTDMNSFNHYAYGSVFDWIFGVAVGIKVPDDGAGYKHITIEPHPDRRMGFVKCSEKVASGTIFASWSYLEGDTVRYEYRIPKGVTADLTLPCGKKYTLSAGEYVFEE